MVVEQQKNLISCLPDMRKPILYILILLASLPASAQESFVEPPSQLITSFSFTQLTGGVMMLHAQLDNKKDTLNFVLDTGSAGISLDSQTVDALGLATEPSDRFVKGIGGVRKVKYTRNHTLKFPGLNVEKLDFHINDYEILSAVYGVRVDGIIGFSFLIRYILSVDFDNQVIKVYSPGEFDYPNGGYMLNVTFNGLPTYPAFIKDVKNNWARYYLDTGAGLNFLVSKGYYDDTSSINKKAPMVVTQAEGIGGKMQMFLTTVKQVRLGPYRFRRVPTYVFDDEFNVTSYPTICGLIGNDILRRFNLVINYQKQQIHLSPNSHFADPFDYAYTGLSIYYENDAVVVEEIMKDSPAEKAGFKKGDIIYGVNNYIGNNIQMIKDRLQSAGEKVKVLIVREGKLDLITMKVASIL